MTLQNVTKWGGLLLALYGVLGAILGYQFDTEKTLLWYGQIVAVLTVGGTAFAWGYLPSLPNLGSLFKAADKPSAAPDDDYLNALRAIHKISLVLTKGGDSKSADQLSAIAMKLFDIYHAEPSATIEIGGKEALDKVMPEIKEMIKKQVKDSIAELFKVKGAV